MTSRIDPLELGGRHLLRRWQVTESTDLSTHCAFFDEAVLRDWCAFEQVDVASGLGASIIGKLVTSRKILMELHCSLRVNLQRKLGNRFMSVLRAKTGVWGGDESLQWSLT